MGMFDTIILKKQIPFNKKQKLLFKNINWEETDFQTKDLENGLLTYIIKENGKLYLQAIEGEHVRIMSEEEEKKQRKNNKFVWPYEFKETSRKLKFQKITQTIFFYHLIKDINGNEWWLDLESVFVNGNLKGNIKIKELRISRTKKQIKEDELRFQKMHSEHEKKIHVKFERFMNKITFCYWRKFFLKFVKVILFFEGVLSKFKTFIYKYIV